MKKSEYNPTNTAAQACPTVGDEWQAASSPLPPTPNKELCSCMTESLSCTLKDDVDEKQIGKLFGYICGMSDGVCDGIAANGKTGKYGAYSMCAVKEQLSFVMNRYYEQQKAQGNGAQACDFNGAATLKSPTSPTGSCKSLMSQAGPEGTGTVTSAPTAGSGSGAAAATSSGAAVPMVAPAAFNFGMMQLGAYIITAFFAGVGMILL